MLRKIIVASMVALALGVASAASPAPMWEDVNAPVPAVTQSLVSDGETEIAIHDGYIYIRTDRTVSVKLFSILGQLISQEIVKPGLHRIKLNTRGIYILRVGSTTRRITL